MLEHTINSLMTDRYDWPVFDSMPPIQYMVATIPRTGSTALCIDLWNSGLLGAPMEYLNLKLIETYGRWGKKITDIPTYWRAIQSVRTSPNGVFGYKMFISNYLQLSARDKQFLALLAPSHVVYLTRQDTIAQAISYSKAMASGEWFKDYRSTGGLVSQRIPKYDKEHIDHARKLIQDQMDGWETVFEMTGAEILRVTYEEFSNDKELTIRKIAKHILNTADGLLNLGLPSIDIQRDSVSKEWVERYLSDNNLNAIPTL